MAARVAGKRPLGAMGRAGIVVGMHAAVLFVIAQGFVMKRAAAPPEDIEITDVDVVRQIDPVPVVAVERYDPDIHVPAPPDPVIDDPAADPPITVIPPDFAVPPEAGGSGDPRPVVMGARQLASRPLSQPLYPPAERRAGNEGSGEIEVLVLPNGRVGDARMARSTGFDGLDRSALQEARSSWRFAPATRDGVAFAQWIKLRVVFRLENER